MSRGLERVLEVDLFENSPPLAGRFGGASAKMSQAAALLLLGVSAVRSTTSSTEPGADERMLSILLLSFATSTTLLLPRLILMMRSFARAPDFAASPFGSSDLRESKQPDSARAVRQNA